MLLNSPVDFLMPTPLHLLLLLVLVSVMAFRAAPGAPLRRWRFLLMAVTAWCWVMSTPVFGHWLGRELEERYPGVALTALPRNPVILVLASGEPWEPAMSNRYNLDLASLRRTITAVHAWRETGGSLIFSGSTWQGNARPAAERMAEFARELGVPAEKIRLETASRTTYENLRNSAALVEGNGAEILLVTSAWHLPRAMAVAHRLGLQPIPVPSDHRARRELTWRAWWPNSRALPTLGLVLHEWAGWLYYRIRGWA